MKSKTAELQGAALDWAVAKADGKADDCEVHAGNVLYGRVTSGFVHYRPSTNWSQGGPLLDGPDGRIQLLPMFNPDYWNARVAGRSAWMRGDTPLIAAMRCYVASKLGDEVDVPEELL